LALDPSNTLEAMMDAIGYARVVPSENTAEALAHQRARIEAFCQEHGYTLVKFFSETISAEIQLEHRIKLLEAIESCTGGKNLIVIRLDRLGSNKKVLYKILEECRSKNVTVVPVAGPKTLEEMPSTLEVTNVQ
jgi:DNA invertase Pin-like site-specific DNA recombinase